ncbi:MAG: 30S ribosomal protein S4e [Candidatus Ranarchaeia archaeon]
MGRKGGSRHQKRISAPKLWVIKRKQGKWTVKTSPGPHNTEKSIPLIILLRDIMKKAKSAREAKYILNQGLVTVDGKIRKDKDYPVGLMDVLEIKSIGEVYRMVPDPSHGLWLHKITTKDAKSKLCRIQNKTTLKNGQLQLNLHDGRNVLIPIEDLQNRVEDVFSTRDIVKIEIPSQKIISLLKFEEGADSVVIDGRNVGKSGKIIEMALRYGPHASTVTLEDPEGKTFETDLDYVFPTGEGIPIGQLVKEQQKKKPVVEKDTVSVEESLDAEIDKNMEENSNE